MGRFLVWALVLGLLGAAGWFGYETLDKTGALRTPPQAPFSCRTIGGVVGAEDLQIDHVSGFAFVSAYDRRAAMAGQDVRGALYALDLSDSSLGLRDLTIASSGAPDEFAPHGLSVARGPSGETLVAVINHKASGHVVEVFEVVMVMGWPTLQHLRTIKDASFTSPNDLALVPGTDEFYLTNDLQQAGGITQFLEIITRQNTGTLVHYNGTRGKIVAAGLSYANGVAIAPHGSLVYVAETTDNVVRAYERNFETGALTLLEGGWGKADTHVSVDNIDVAPDGHIYVAAHSNLWALAGHGKDGSVLSPSEVLRLSPAQNGWQAETIIADDGREISGISVAAVGVGQIVLGQIFGNGILICPLAE